MAFRRHIARHVILSENVSALWKECHQATKRTLSIMKSPLTLDRMTVSDLEDPRRVLMARKEKKNNKH